MRSLEVGFRAAAGRPYAKGIPGGRKPPLRESDGRTTVVGSSLAPELRNEKQFTGGLSSLQIPVRLGGILQCKSLADIGAQHALLDQAEQPLRGPRRP